MQNLPLFISVLFALTTFLTVWLFYKASGNSKTTLVVLYVWLTLQCIIGFTGFYTVTNSIPPRFALLVIPPLLFIVILFITAKGRLYIDSLALASSQSCTL